MGQLTHLSEHLNARVMKVTLGVEAELCLKMRYVEPKPRPLVRFKKWRYQVRKHVPVSGTIYLGRAR